MPAGIKGLLTARPLTAGGLKADDYDVKWALKPFEIDGEGKNWLSMDQDCLKAQLRMAWPLCCKGVCMCQESLAPRPSTTRQKSWDNTSQKPCI